MGDEMRPYVVRQGEYLEKLAWIHGFDAAEVWGHEKNKELADRREDHNILAPGDLIYLPVKRDEGLPIEKGAVNRYVAKVPRMEVSLILRQGITPLANQPYEVRGLEDPTARGTTGDDGSLTLRVPVKTREIEIVLPQFELSYPVRLGDLDPLAEDTGARMRLSNLGYLPTTDGGQTAEALHAWAVRRFQRDAGLAETGEIDEATRAELGRAHGR